jgi:chromosome segregation ATPase
MNAYETRVEAKLNEQRQRDLDEIATARREIANRFEEIARTRNALFDERQRLSEWSRRLSNRNDKLVRRERTLKAGQEVRRQERAEITAAKRELEAERKALEDLRLQADYDRAADPDDDEPDMTQLTLLPDYLAPELASLRRTIREMQAWDEQETAEIWAAMLRAVTSIEQQGREAFERKQALRAMWTVRKAS